MKIHVPSFLLILFVFCLSSCGERSEEVKIAMRLSKGDTFGIRNKTEMNYSMEIMGKKQEIKLKSESETVFKVIDSTASGVDLKMSVTKQESDIRIGMGDSAIQHKPNESLKNMLDIPVYLKIKDRKITEVKGLDSMMKTADSITQKMFGQAEMDKLFKQMTSTMFDVYPEKPVKVGESWTGTSTIMMAGLSLDIITKYKLEKVRDGIAYISANGSMNAQEAELPMVPGLKMTMNGKQGGTISIRLESGYLNKSNYEIDMTADAKFAGENVPLVIKGKVVNTGL